MTVFFASRPLSQTIITKRDQVHQNYLLLQRLSACYHEMRLVQMKLCGWLVLVHDPPQITTRAALRAEGKIMKIISHFFPTNLWIQSNNQTNTVIIRVRSIQKHERRKTKSRQVDGQPNQSLQENKQIFTKTVAWLAQW